VKEMPESEYMAAKTRNKKRTIGAIAIIMLLIFTALAILNYIDFIVWVLADLIVAAVANILLKRVSAT
jgi:hypothetical protein